MKELKPSKEEDVELETNPSYQSVAPAVQVEGGGLEGPGEMNYMNVGLVLQY